MKFNISDIGNLYINSKFEYVMKLGDAAGHSTKSDQAGRKQISIL